MVSQSVDVDIGGSHVKIINNKNNTQLKVHSFLVAGRGQKCFVWCWAAHSNIYFASFSHRFYPEAIKKYDIDSKTVV